MTALYWYLTDFCINAANLLGISYVEFNFALFLVVIPSVLTLLFLLNLFRYALLPIVDRIRAK